MEYLDNKVNNSAFTLTLYSYSKHILADHIQIYLAPATRPSEDISTYGKNAQERKLKKIIIHHRHIVDYLEKLVLCTNFVEKGTEDYIVNQLGISELEYYQYHYETFLVTASSVLDLLALFGNEIYNLEIKPNKCNPYNYIKNKNKHKKDSANILSSFQDFLCIEKKARNIIIHAGGYESQEIKSIESNIMKSSLKPLGNLLENWLNNNKKIKIDQLISHMNTILLQSIDFSFLFIESLTNALNKIIPDTTKR